MDKKVSNKVWTLVNNIAPGTPKNIDYEKAFDVIAEWGHLEGGIDTRADGYTTFDIWIEGEKVKVLPIKNGWNEKERDWNWHEVFGQVIDYIFDEGLIKKPRAKRKDAKVQKVNKAVVNRTKTAQISKETEKMTKSIEAEKISRKNKEFEKEWYSEKNLNDLKKRLGNLSVKKSDWKKKGKDITELEKMMDEFREKIKDIKNHGYEV